MTDRCIELTVGVLNLEEDDDEAELAAPREVDFFGLGSANAAAAVIGSIRRALHASIAEEYEPQTSELTSASVCNDNWTARTSRYNESRIRCVIRNCGDDNCCSEGVEVEP